MNHSALLALADGTLMYGRSIGASDSTVGEIVFNTAMTGYQEILTDPSYSQQIVTLTYPHIGSTGVTSEDAESNAVHAAGLVIRDLPLSESNFRSERDLSSYLKDAGVVAMCEIDTRHLTRILRDSGAQNACLMAVPEGQTIDEAMAKQALASARGFSGLKGLDLAKEVSVSESYEWTQGEWQLGAGFTDNIEQPHHVVVYDFGVKINILRMLAQRGCRLTVVPAKTSAQEVMALNPDGIMLSNGPGDPEPCDYAIAAIKTLLAETSIPIFGICLGHQLLALAVGASTSKMKFGHHGANHPVQDLATSKVMITSQNHGFAVDEASLPDHVEATHKSLFDGSLQGIRLINRKAFGFQGHPEASPGPADVAMLFDQFVDDIASA
ncbi:MAG: glutamine-hydrolyzing carbamoyl-phosphate synthase small subunit [Pseudomonadota bacterium]